MFSVESVKVHCMWSFR